jgi:hypothetical protein
LRAAWLDAPTLQEFLHALVESAETLPNYISNAPGSVAVAARSQKPNESIEYVRAFGLTLRDLASFKFLNELYAAIALTARLVLNDLALTVKDVREALTKLPKPR